MSVSASSWPTAVDLRIAGFKNVVLSLAGAPNSSETLSKDMGTSKK
jgi:hypothetical protein